MHYFDTSFVAPLILREPASQWVEAFMLSLPAGELAVSHWTCVEFSSLLAREVRMGSLAGPEALGADSRFGEMLAQSFIVLPLVRGDFDLAREYLRNYATGLRAGDALHLAIAHNNRRVQAIYTLDKAMAKAGLLLGLPMKETGIA
ncbi:MAG: type II toxin-antitoxin system VapC family toxin [Magnetococcales bacterium]|nr:type II toxin-antitoxin system VapC family toxin [Magnetococcales bacterium]